ncbi:phosphatidylglycerophosphatase A [Methylophaga sp. OBS3]|uniref:phosphatidylglycerophosphatase A family protein n=1 Tax=Methylophaga sp. OBS3 TaxID=2991934 RepID=UPI002252A536|nr:phosphatidylglycerophosphatase A [Methylophaga sp. OBS3]MCX4190370.1 phosphatidylglycerophosphatase A [Methylophaga sp. OBS3]
MTTSTKPSTREIIKKPAVLLACGLGSGLIPKAPGTFGTIAAIPLYLLMQPLSLLNYLILTFTFFVVGIWLSAEAIKVFKRDDPSEVVWDEVVGLLVTMIAAPAGLLWVLLGFVLFRIFDIWKPWPVSLADIKLHGGLGIMLDDVIAGIYALIVLQAIAFMI